MDILNETAPEVPPSLLELETEQKVVGVKQLKRALREGRAQRVFLAEDADPHLIAPVVQLCSQPLILPGFPEDIKSAPWRERKKGETNAYF